MPPNDESAAAAPSGTPEQNASAVTPNQSGEPAVTPKTAQVPQGYQLIKDEDINKLKSTADKAKNGDSETQAVVNALLQKDAIRDTMADPEFKENYPDVTQAELLDANPMSDEEVIEVAKARQARYEEVKQTALLKVQIADAPTITQADKDTQMKELAKPAKVSRFQQAIRLSRTQVK